MSTPKRTPRGSKSGAGDVWIWVATGTAMLVIVGMVAFVAMRHSPSDTGTVPPMAMQGGYERHPMNMPAAHTAMPDYAARAGITDAYEYALANPDILTYIPCTCGCAAMGHLSNWNCYVKEISADGRVTFDPHATGCETCVLITRDVIDMRARGTPLDEIRDYIDATYGGQPTDTEYPPTV